MTSRDLVVLAADKDAEHAIRGLLSKPRRLGIREITFDVFVHPQHDSGCSHRSHDFRRPFQNRYQHAIVLFDLEGSGQESVGGEVVESTVEGHLQRAGWGDRAAALVLVPELEIWTWTQSVHTEDFLGWTAGRTNLDACLVSMDHSRNSLGKPRRPKEAVEDIWRQTGTTRSASRFHKLASSVGLGACKDRTFRKFRERLREWFAADET